MGKGSRVLLIVSVLSTVTVLVGIGLVRRFRAETAEEDPRGVPVRVSRPVRGTITENLRYTGHLFPAKSIMVLPKISGRIDRILVEKGDPVANRQELALIEDESLMLRMDQAYSAWRAAEAQYEKATRGLREQEIENARAIADMAEKDYRLAFENADRVRRLYDKGAVSKSQLEEADSALNAAKTGVENAGRTLRLMEEGASAEELTIVRENALAMKAQYELAQLQAGYSVVRSPEAGTVADVLVDQGNMVGPTVPLLLIIQDDPIIARISIPEQYYRELQELLSRSEQSAAIRPVAYGGEEPFEGVIQRLDPVVDPVSRTFSVEVEVKNPEGLLRPGMYVNAEIRLREVSGVLLVPAGALVRRNGEETLFVAAVGDAGVGIAEMRVVETGLRDVEAVEILRGVAADERIIIEGNAFLEDGQEIEVLASP